MFRIEKHHPWTAPQNATGAWFLRAAKPRCIKHLLSTVSIIETFTYTSRFDCTAAELYAFHSRPGALERLLPPWDGSEVVWKKGSIGPGGKVLIRLHPGPLTIDWEAHHVEEIPGVMFRDIQHRGPFAHFQHTHTFADSDAGCLLTDTIGFALPGQRWLPALAAEQVRSTLSRIFRYREHLLRYDLQLHARYSHKPLRLLISGASGVLGRVLVPLLTTGGHEVWTLVRRPPLPGSREIFWDPWQGHLDPSQLPELDGVIHLAGEYIGLGRWTPDKKERVVASRSRGTGLLARTLAGLPSPPAVFLSASAVGYYGDCGVRQVTEEQPVGADFISEVCNGWENSTAPAAEAGIRTVLMRLGVGLTPPRRRAAAAAGDRSALYFPPLWRRQPVCQLDEHRRHGVRHAPLPGHPRAARPCQHCRPTAGHQPGTAGSSRPCGWPPAASRHTRRTTQAPLWTDGRRDSIVELSGISR